MQKLGLENKLLEELRQENAELKKRHSEDQDALAQKDATITSLQTELDSARETILQFDIDKIATCVEDYSRNSTDMLKAVMDRIDSDGYTDIKEFIVSEFAKRDTFISELVKKLNFLSLSATKKSERQVQKGSNGLKVGQTLDSDNMKHAATEDAKSRGNNNAKHDKHNEIPFEPKIEEKYPEGYSKDNLKGAKVLDKRRSCRICYVRGYIKRVYTDNVTIRTADGRILKANPSPVPLLGSIYDSSFLAHIITMKFGWHQSITSVAKQLSDIGFNTHEGTLNGMIMKVCSSLFFRNLDMTLQIVICKTKYKQMDESYSYVRTYIAKIGKEFIKQCWFWGLMSMELKLIRYSCSNGSRSDAVGYALVEMILTFCIIQADAKSCYRKMGQDDLFTNITRIGCTQHLKRKFLIDDDPRALEIYSMLNQLYVLEHERIKLSGIAEANGEKWSDEMQIQWRRENMLPVLLEAEEHMKNVLNGTPKPGTKAFELSGQPISEKLKSAINYAMNEASAIEGIFQQDILCKLDNNSIESCNRAFGFHRRVSKTFGSMKGAEQQAIFISLMESARMWKINLEEYMTYLLENMSKLGNEVVENENSKAFETYRNLLPDKYAATHPRKQEYYPEPPLRTGPLNEGSTRMAYKKRKPSKDVPSKDVPPNDVILDITPNSDSATEIKISSS